MIVLYRFGEQIS